MQIKVVKLSEKRWAVTVVSDEQRATTGMTFEELRELGATVQAAITRELDKRHSAGTRAWVAAEQQGQRHIS